MASPWLSVIIPSFNGERYIAAALDSVVAQHDDGVECVVVDDGSGDATTRIVSSYSPTLPIRLLQRPHLGNWVASSNHGLELAAGQYACFLHQDDLWLANRLKLMKPLILEHPACALYLHSSR